MRRLAVFDLDHTLLADDSDHLWGRWLVEQGVVDREHYARENERFYGQYKAGTLDMHEYAAFSLQPLTEHPIEQMLTLRERFIREWIVPVVASGTPALLERHRAQGDELLITSATNRFITEPIAGLLGVDHLIATDPERRDGRYTGRIAGIPNFQAGKVRRLRDWLAARTQPFTHVTAYSDSRNDIPLLEEADTAIAVDPDAVLRATAESRGWPIISLR
ncbi:HAD family hydrolase [Solimonas marina]|uniref:HAD family hydrolase n=1 Tax=Solimonas marina TaxID=2714601 RepID=A0A969W502_9GAMM|nr:HAD family hydrolase [Solimonas marina]NKF20687.1 HAD family hydrolase [Solimonas marina]